MVYEAITLQDCLDMYYMKDQAAVIENGQVTGFTKDI
jgi:hypothetical protein